MAAELHAIEGDKGSDVDKAARARAEITPLLEKICEILNRAKADGLIVSFNCSPDQYGRYKIVDIGIVKPL
jgi:hypothetical protein